MEETRCPVAIREEPGRGAWGDDKHNPLSKKRPGHQCIPASRVAESSRLRWKQHSVLLAPCASSLVIGNVAGRHNPQSPRNEHCGIGRVGPIPPRSMEPKGSIYCANNCLPNLTNHCVEIK